MKSRQIAPLLVKIRFDSILDFEGSFASSLFFNPFLQRFTGEKSYSSSFLSFSFFVEKIGYSNDAWVNENRKVNIGGY